MHHFCYKTTSAQTATATATTATTTTTTTNMTESFEEQSKNALIQQQQIFLF